MMKAFNGTVQTMMKAFNGTALRKSASLVLMLVVLGSITMRPASAHHRPDHTQGGKPTASPTPEPTPTAEPDPTPVPPVVWKAVEATAGTALCTPQILNPFGSGWSDFWGCAADRTRPFWEEVWTHTGPTYEQVSKQLDPAVAQLLELDRQARDALFDAACPVLDQNPVAEAGECVKRRDET